MPQTTFQVWQIGGSVTCIAIEKVEEWRAKGQLDPDAKLLHEFQAAGKQQMMRTYFELMGWGHYQGLGGDDTET